MNLSAPVPIRNPRRQYTITNNIPTTLLLALLLTLLLAGCSGMNDIIRPRRGMPAEPAATAAPAPVPTTATAAAAGDHPGSAPGGKTAAGSTAAAPGAAGGQQTAGSAAADTANPAFASAHPGAGTAAATGDTTAPAANTAAAGAAPKAAAVTPDYLPEPPPPAWHDLADRPRYAPDSEPVELELAFDNADLYEVLDTTLFELYEVSYMIDPSINVKVSFRVSGSYTRRQFINLLNNVLQLSNLTIVPGPGSIYKIVPRPRGGGANTDPVGEGSIPGAAGDATRLIRLRYLSAQAAIALVQPFMSPGAPVIQSTVTNDLIISDTVENITKAATILSLVDVPYFKEIIWRVFPLYEVEAIDLAQDLTKIVQTAGLYNRPGIDQTHVQILPIKTMNALLVATRWPEMMNTVADWIAALDHSQSSDSDVFIYFVENGSAVELSDILKQLFGGTASEAAGTAGRRTIVQPANQGNAAAQSSLAGGGELTGEVEIIPDETNNAIVFKANFRDYRVIHKVLLQLDIVPRQVLINVTVAEISLSGKVKYGIEWFIQGHGDKGYTFQGVLDDGVSRAVDTSLGSTTGFTLGVFDGDDFLRGLISALGTDSDVNILSSPNIMAVDNKEARIEVGTEVPTVTGQVTDATSGSTVTNTIQYRKTGIILSVTPHINSSGLVKLELSQEVSDVGEYDNALNTYSILNRKAETSLVVHDGQTIVLAGLIKNNQTTSNSGVPFLKDIPGLGLLFGGTNHENTRTELVLLLTPHVINNREDVDNITREFTQKVDRVREAIESGSRK
jgi:general secretion pathway protein D